MIYLFVFGTLKRGYPLHHHLEAALFQGAWRTVERYPLVVAGPRYAPMLLREPKVGRHILGELYAIRAQTLLRLDRVESIGHTGNFRGEVEIENGIETRRAHAYFKSRELASPLHSKYLSSYEDRRFVPDES